MNKRLFAIVLVTLMATTLGMFFCINNNNDVDVKGEAANAKIAGTESNVRVVGTVSMEDLKNTLDQSEVSFVDGLYVDGATNIMDLKKNAELIILGTAISQELPSKIAVATKVKVTKTLKGKQQDEIIIYQFNGEEVLIPGEEYYLFLGKQTDGQENSFFIKGGFQGLFDKSDRIQSRDGVINESMKELYKEKAAGESDTEFFERWIAE
ncbi:hypothetical protein [Paenibacillus kobensis]|uniref:hypothetical protein n=1 Tax=Paenibacillus kobensis TaxID=59841 RepID=UPI000FD8A69B|nr:hypothetical protein [Paenibacillus kobensis]